MRKPSLKEDVDSYGSLKAVLSDLVAEYKELSTRIKEALHARGRVQFTGDAYCVQLAERNAPDQIDREKLITRYGRGPLEREGILVVGGKSEYMTVAPTKKLPKLPAAT